MTEAEYVYLKDIGSMRTIKVEKVQILSPKQILIKYDERFQVVADTHLISVERYQDIKKKEAERRLKHIKEWMNNEGIEVGDMYDILQRIDAE